MDGAARAEFEDDDDRLRGRRRGCGRREGGEADGEDGSHCILVVKIARRRYSEALGAVDGGCGRQGFIRNATLVHGKGFA